MVSFETVPTIWREGLRKTAGYLSLNPADIFIRNIPQYSSESVVQTSAPAGKFIIIIIIIIIIINCNWVVTRWQWLFYAYTNMEKKSN